MTTALSRFRCNHTQVNTATKFRARVSFNGNVVAETEGAELNLAIPDAQLWWPNGHGAQPLYEVQVELLDEDNRVLDVWNRRTGLRTLELDRLR
jgi:beta-mannosidase